MRAGKADALGRVKVCVFSPHPAVLRELERLLSGGEFSLKSVPGDFRLTSDLAEPKIPSASAYVVDAHGPRASVEALIILIMRRYPKARVLIVQQALTDATVFPFLRLGAKGVVSFAEVGRDLGRSVKAIAAGGFWVPRAVLSRFVDPVLPNLHERTALVGPSMLSRRERQVLDPLLRGLANKDIANRLNISEGTVKFHVSNLLDKFKVRRRDDLIVLSFQRAQLFL